ncbi:hypothetical protein Pla163_00020 [Planctomycetes bacterium Pla163]|uniref:Uncharacterized protein n=1 Tax=Rohdeia mirabilis TaxID=2528008 RepID=A0A518CUL9_9BACT|nr:hypothetical protein Pla163_00020 [Planctomycetes bacterium Pla163]
MVSGPARAVDRIRSGTVPAPCRRTIRPRRRARPGAASRHARRRPGRHPTPSRPVLDRTPAAVSKVPGSRALGSREPRRRARSAPPPRAPGRSLSECRRTGSRRAGEDPLETPSEPAVFGLRNHPSGPLFRYHMAFDEGPLGSRCEARPTRSPTTRSPTTRSPTTRSPLLESPGPESPSHRSRNGATTARGPARWSVPLRGDERSRPHSPHPLVESLRRTRWPSLGGPFSDP